MRIIGYRTSLKEGKVLIEETGGEFLISANPEEMIAFLMEPYKDSIRVCWNLDATVAVMLPFFGLRVSRELREKKRAHMPPWSLFYVPGKVFSIRHIPTHQTFKLYELEQYFPDLPDTPDFNGPEELCMLGQKLMYELNKMGFQPRSLTSPIRIYDDCVMSRLSLPKLADMPLRAAELAYSASGRLWIESHQLGYWNNCYDYDMNSAFPMVARDMIDTRDCEWIESSHYVAHAIYGYAQCQVTIYDWVMVSPIMQDTKDSLMSPVGTWETVLSKSEMDFITRHKIGTFEILAGWWAVPRVKPELLRKPLWEPMTKLLVFKQRTGIQRLLAKRMSTGVYGKLGEERTEEFGPYFFPPWFCEISGQTRLKVAEFLYAFGIGPGDSEKYRTLIHIGVDGVLLSEPVNYSGGDRWKLTHETDALVVSSGLVYTRTTRPKGLVLQDILDMITEHPRSSYYAKRVKRRLTLSDSLAQNRLAEVGREIFFNSSISLIEQQHDRDFAELPKTGEALLGRKFCSTPKMAEKRRAEEINGVTARQKDVDA